MEQVTISKELLRKILVYFWLDMEPSRDSLTDDADAAIIYDGLEDEFDEDRLEELFPDGI